MTNGLGNLCRKALKNAKQQNRLVVGLTPAVKTLSNDPDDTMFCFLAQPKPGDSAAHMQTILLEAFCYEHGIYTINVDDTSKLTSIVGVKVDTSCVLIQRVQNNDICKMDMKQSLKLKIFDLEERLIDHCEDYWHAQYKPTIRLPDD